MYPDVVTWNPLAGECLHKCSYCSTNSLMRFPIIKEKYTGEIRLDYKTLNKNLGKGKIIFVAAQNDLFANGVPFGFVCAILGQCYRYDNTYLFQTKNPRQFIEFSDLFPTETILCTTIETNREYIQMGNAPHPFDRAKAMRLLWKHEIQVTIEPIMSFDLNQLVTLIKMCNPCIVNIGADSKRNNLPEPSKEELLALINELEIFTMVAKKKNLNRLLK